MLCTVGNTCVVQITVKCSCICRKLELVLIHGSLEIDDRQLLHTSSKMRGLGLCSKSENNSRRFAMTSYT